MKSIFNFSLLLFAFLFITSCNKEESITVTTDPDIVYGKVGLRNSSKKLVSIESLTDSDSLITYYLTYDAQDRLINMSDLGNERYDLSYYGNDSIVISTTFDGVEYQKEVFLLNSNNKIGSAYVYSNGVLLSTMGLNYDSSNRLNSIDVVSGTDSYQLTFKVNSDHYLVNSSIEGGNFKVTFDPNSPKMTTNNILLAGLITESPWLAVLLTNSGDLPESIPTKLTFLDSNLEIDFQNTYSDNKIVTLYEFDPGFQNKITYSFQ